jgi:hypothetical protein
MRALMVVISLIFCFPLGATARDKGQANSDDSLRPVLEGRYAAMKSAMAELVTVRLFLKYLPPILLVRMLQGRRKMRIR